MNLSRKELDRVLREFEKKQKPKEQERDIKEAQAFLDSFFNPRKRRPRNETR